MVVFYYYFVYFNCFILFCNVATVIGVDGCCAGAVTYVFIFLKASTLSLCSFLITCTKASEVFLKVATAFL